MDQKGITLRTLWAIRDASATADWTAAEYAVLSALNARCQLKPEGYTCLPSLRLLAKDTHLSISTVQRAAASLHKKRIITWQRRHNSSNVWVINAQLLDEMAQKTKARKKAGFDDVEDDQPNPQSEPHAAALKAPSPLDVAAPAKVNGLIKYTPIYG